MEPRTRTYPCPDCGAPMVVAFQPRPRTGKGRHSHGFGELLYGCPVVLEAHKTRKAALVLAETGHAPYVRWWPEWMAQAYADGARATCPVVRPTWDADESPF